MATWAILSFRLGLSDGVPVVAARWGTILERLGHRVVFLAGEEPVDRPAYRMTTARDGKGMEPSGVERAKG